MPRTVGPQRDHKAGAALVDLAQTWHRRLNADTGGATAGKVGLRFVHGLLLLRFLEVRGGAPAGRLRRAGLAGDCAAGLAELFEEASERFGAAFDVPVDAAELFARPLLLEFLRELDAPAAAQILTAAPVEALGHAYEQCLGDLRSDGGRKAGGVYYTPIAIAERLVEQTVGDLLMSTEQEPASLRIIDPACGTGAFLLSAYDRLAAAQVEYLLRQPPRAQRGRLRWLESTPVLTVNECERLAGACLFGVDLDQHALALARLALYLRIGASGRRQLDLFAAPLPPALIANVTAGNSLIDLISPADAPVADCPSVGGDGGGDVAAAPGAFGAFDAVLGNPPWGQKAIDASSDVKQRIRSLYPSSRGIFDWFRPFVELGLRLIRAGGAWGMVLPDIVLLKNYEPTRQLMLQELAMTRIEWLGMAFSGATIDAVTIAGRKGRAAPEHRVQAVVYHSGDPIDHFIRQGDFARNPRSAFNLYMTDEKRSCLDKLADASVLSEFFEVHEGIHSGNIRAELFVERSVDASCKPLLFGRDELRPYSLRWNGRFVRLSAVPDKRTRQRYANLGQRCWHEQPKILVRRTGDRVTAAVDSELRYASNNFFLIVRKRDHPLTLHGLCALLNSGFLTWLFRTVEPRKGRAFAELKIKHLNAFPLPTVAQRAECADLNRLGLKRATCEEGVDALDAEIDAAALALFDLVATPAGVPRCRSAA